MSYYRQTKCFITTSMIFQKKPPYFFSYLSLGVGATCLLTSLLVVIPRWTYKLSHTYCLLLNGHSWVNLGCCRLVHWFVAGLKRD